MALRGRMVGVVVVLGLGGCATTAVNDVTDSTGTPAVAHVAQGSPVTAPCRLSQLAVTLGRGGAGLGTTYQQIDFRNLGATACVLDGYPSLVFLDGRSHVVGGPATRANIMGTPLVAVTVAPGESGHASMGVETAANDPPSACRPTATIKIRVTVPGDPSGRVIAMNQVVCSIGPLSTLISQFAAGVPGTAVG